MCVAAYYGHARDRNDRGGVRSSLGVLAGGARRRAFDLESQVAAPAERKTFPADLPEGLKPRLRLFLSVDLVGSTAFKQSRLAWLPAMLNFYRDFDALVHAQYRAHRERTNNPPPPPEFWKSNGDELLYTCDLTGRDQAIDALHIWLSTLNAYRCDLATLVEDLDVKSTAWIALFPAPNAEVFFRRAGQSFQADAMGDALLLQAEMRDQWYGGRRHELTRDFVGPSIDTGFRLTGWATPRRMVLSADLAFLLTSSTSGGAEPLPLHVSGRQKLKGVVGDAPYPMIWLPVGAAKKDGRDDSIGRTLAEPVLLRAYCEAIIEQNYKVFPPLFLADDPAEDGDYGWAPPFILKQITKRWADETRRREALAA